MPIYEFRCGCGCEKEVILSLEEYDQPQICECGEVMQLKVSLSGFTFKPYANDMALNTLNEQRYGHGMPNRWWKPEAERKAFEGTQTKAKAVW